MDIISSIKAAARERQKTIVLPEADDDRILQAACIAVKEKLAKIMLIGSPEEVKKRALTQKLEEIDAIEIIDPVNHKKKDEYISLLVELRKSKGLSPEQAEKWLHDPLCLACAMLKNGDADGEVAGAINATGDVLRPAFKIIKTQPGISIVSSSFLMILNDKSLGHNGAFFFADCAVNINPNEKELAEIAISTASSAQAIIHGFEPRVAMLSFSTKGSAKHEMADKVINATRIAKEMDKDLMIDGELQGDAALTKHVMDKKAPGSPIEGKANVLVFPDLNAGNIAYKLVQYLAGAVAVGPLLQGIAKPVNDLSRGCSVDDIVISVAITANQAN